ncbi:MAG: (Fe-S)-binding protein [Desulfotomaculaceae bacterium]|nr:(Fe-S)-binding protein [Desulfotomaculaceae bacterium]
MQSIQYWLPPGKNCGLCGEMNCKSFIRMVNNGQKVYTDCPFYQKKNCSQEISPAHEAIYTGRDILGHQYDFVLRPLPGEVSARKIVLPFRSDMVEKMKIAKGDYVLGRPMGAGCPIPHVLQVIEAEVVTGLLYTWVVGPAHSRDNKETKDVIAYHMIGFEGIATEINKEPTPGSRATFLPGFCMMDLNHTGLVNMVLKKSNGLHVRIEDIRILAATD